MTREMSLAAFIGHLAGASAALRHETRHALERAAKVVEREAKAEIGTYQEAAPPFVGWAELADATKADRVRHGFSEDEPLLRTGGLRDSIGHAVEMKAGAAGEAIVGSTSEIAVFQELGTARMPPRSFLGGALVRKSEEVAKICGAGVVKALVGPGVLHGRVGIR